MASVFVAFFSRLETIFCLPIQKLTRRLSFTVGFSDFGAKRISGQGEVLTEFSRKPGRVPFPVTFGEPFRFDVAIGLRSTVCIESNSASGPIVLGRLNTLGRPKLTDFHIGGVFNFGILG